MKTIYPIASWTRILIVFPSQTKTGIKHKASQLGIKRLTGKGRWRLKRIKIPFASYNPLLRRPRFRHANGYMGIMHYENWYKMQFNAKGSGREYVTTHKQYPKYREMVEEIYGDGCAVCGWKGNLHLHHLWYERDSVPSNASGGGIRRMIEAIQHPERFVRLCRQCHTAVTKITMTPDALNRIQMIVEAGRSKTPLPRPLSALDSVGL